MTEIAQKKVLLLGATGSIGANTLRVIRKHSDRLNLVGVAAHSKAEALGAICREFDVKDAVISEEKAISISLAEDFFPTSTNLRSGPDAMTELAANSDADIVVIAVVGACGLKPALAAIEAGKDVALANKELLVLGGAFVIEAAKRKGVRLLPTDSEHNAIFQCMEGHPQKDVDKIILTASGGMFRDRPINTLSTVTPAEATKHPNWSMGPKITVDSATMANKGLELIEAYWLFGLAPDRLEVTIHPESIVHSFVQYVDGSILAQLSPPSMTFAIQHCLLYPERAEGVDQTLDFREAMQLNFHAPDYERYPCLKLAYEAMCASGSAPAVYNAANEIAVNRFLKKEIGFLEIPRLIEHCLSEQTISEPDTLETLFQIDAATRELAASLPSKKSII